MARSKDPRKTDRWHRGAKRTGDLSPHVLPGDTEENSRDHNRLWDRIEGLAGKLEKIIIREGNPGDVIVIPPESDDPTYTELITAAVPWAWWRHFDTSGNTLADSTGNGRTLGLTGLGSPAYRQAGIPGELTGFSIDYNGGEYGLNSGVGFDYGESWTVEGWFNPNATGNQGMVGSQSNAFGYANQWGIRMQAGGTLICSVAGPSSTGSVTDSTVYTVDDWIYVAIVADVDEFTFYVNGEAVGTAAIQVGFNDNNDSIKVGNWDFDSGAFTDSNSWNGLISEVAVYTRALTAAEIDDHYRIGAGLGTGDLGTDPIPLPPGEAFEDGAIPAVKITPGTNGDWLRTAGGEAVWEAHDSVEEHVAESDPHTQYQKESEKGVANGYASLGAGGRVPVAQLGSGTPDGTLFLRDDGTFASPAGGSLALDDLTDVDTTGVADGDALVYDSASGDWIPAAVSGGGGGGVTSVHAFKVRRAASQAGATGSFTTVSFDTEDKDTDGSFAATSTNVTIQTAGTWQFNAACEFISPGTNHIFIRIVKNGTTIADAGPWDHTSYNIRAAVSTSIDCLVGDVITVTLYQDSGSSKNFVAELDGFLVGGVASAARGFEVKLFGDTELVTTGDGRMTVVVPALLNGLNLTAVIAAVSTVSSSGIPTVAVRRERSGVAVDMLSTSLTIDASEKTSATATTAAVIDAANDDLATGDLIHFDVDVAGTGTKGLCVALTFS